MVSVLYHGTSLVMIDAIFRTNLLLENNSFYYAISEHEAFDMANVGAHTISKLLKKSNLQMTIETYFRPWSKAETYDDPHEPTVIYLNQWHNSRSIPGFCNTFIHKIVHAVNAENPQYEFGHGDNSAIGKENTAPYWIGNLAEQMVLNRNKLITPPQNIVNNFNR